MSEFRPKTAPGNGDSSVNFTLRYANYIYCRNIFSSWPGHLIIWDII